MQDTIFQTKGCAHCTQEFIITQADMEFYAKISPTFDGQIFAVPAPTLCPDCRQRRRLAFRNERNLYRRTCDASGKQIISIYSPEKPYKVYDQKTRWSDSRNPMDYGRDFDFSKTFTEQYDLLMKAVPLAPLTNEYTKQENCDYANSAGPGKNCYMSFEFAFCENLLYSKSVFYSKNSIDCSYGSGLDECYGCVDSDACFSCLYVQYCNDCSFCRWCYNCKNCQYCINCDNLENKSYCIENKQYDSKEEFEKASATYRYQKRDFPKLPQGRLVGNEHVTHAKNVLHAKDSSYVFGCQEIQNVKYAGDVFDVQDSYDFFSWGENVSQSYELQESGRNLHKSAFLWLCRDNISDVYYSYYCTLSSNLFGCVAVRNKQYCIFNKQYTKEEYEKQVAKIIAHMQETGERGEFFHPSLSPFGYNETVAQEYYPVQKDELASLGYTRSDYESPKPVSDKVIQGKDLPATIEEVEDSILQSAIACEVTGKLFRIQPQELVFYRKHTIPLPRKHPDQRHLERLQLRK